MEGLTSRAEDYLRVIYQIVKRKGYARVKDVAAELGVSPSSVTEMVRKLGSMGLVVYEKYGGITLTPRGEELARVIYERHEVFERFLRLIGVPEEVAARDSHILEHKLHPETVARIARLAEFLSGNRECRELVEKSLGAASPEGGGSAVRGGRSWPAPGF